MRCFKSRPRRTGSEGFILVAVLWILGALATLTGIYALYVSEAAVTMSTRNDRIHAQALTAAAVELAAYQLTAVPEARPTRGGFGFQMGGADVAVDFRSETARIDLNAAPRELLAGLFTVLGARSDDATGFADRILGWRTPPPPAGGSDSEESMYRTAGKKYSPRRAPFPHVNELGLVLGMTPVLIDRALPYLTVYSGAGGINVLDAAPEVLAALPGMTPERLQVLLAQREIAGQEILKALPLFLGPAARYVSAQTSKATRMTVDVRFDANRRMRAEVVILTLDGDVEPFRVLSWRDDVDEPAPVERPNPKVR